MTRHEGSGQKPFPRHGAMSIPSRVQPVRTAGVQLPGLEDPYSYGQASRTGVH